MYKVRAFKELNAVLGILKGEMTVDEINTYGNDVVRTIERKLMPGFIYLMDVTKFKSGHNADIKESNEKIDEIEFFLSKMGLKHVLIIGSDENEYLSNRVEMANSKESVSRLFFSNLEEAINYLASNIDTNAK